ncbi:MAG TPA: ACP S-malonyltransferase [Verrucomicrobiae bacterium]|nr:ACP S-malonyltransferase [Verrucomicrobiae bacterium]
MKYAVLFPGQGSQSVGMLAALAAAFPVVDQTFDEAGTALGWDVARLVREGPIADLNRTERTQPALLAADIAVWRAWQAQSPAAPVAMAGHSLGEYAALVAAGSLPFAEALKLVELRGQLMQGAVPAGAGGMVALVGMEDTAVEALCASYAGGEVLEPVNYNAPGQVVVAGAAGALKWLEENAKAAGARMAIRLPVSVPSHCALMKGAALELATRLTHVPFQSPLIPVLHNLDAAAHASPVSLRGALREQLYKPVRWTQTVQALSKMDATVFLECGPGKVLTGLNKRILDRATPTFALEEPLAVEQALAKIRE